jgi:hypothetical protein
MVSSARLPSSFFIISALFFLFFFFFFFFLVSLIVQLKRHSSFARTLTHPFPLLLRPVYPLDLWTLVVPIIRGIITRASPHGHHQDMGT